MRLRILVTAALVATVFGVMAAEVQAAPATLAYRAVKVGMGSLRYPSVVGISNQGKVFGFYGDNNGYSHPFMYVSGKIVNLPDYQGAHFGIESLATNGPGMIAATGCVKSGCASAVPLVTGTTATGVMGWVVLPPVDGMAWSSSRTGYAAAINRPGSIAGQETVKGKSFPVVWAHNKSGYAPTALPAAGVTDPTGQAIDRRGDVLGSGGIAGKGYTLVWFWTGTKYLAPYRLTCGTFGGAILAAIRSAPIRSGPVKGGWRITAGGKCAETKGYSVIWRLVVSKSGRLVNAKGHPLKHAPGPMVLGTPGTPYTGGVHAFLPDGTPLGEAWTASPKPQEDAELWWGSHYQPINLNTVTSGLGHDVLMAALAANAHGQILASVPDQTRAYILDPKK